MTHKPIYRVTDYGSNFNSTTILAALSDIGSNSTSLYFDEGTWTITTNLTFPINVKLVFSRGAILYTSSTSITITINGEIEAGDYQIFSYTNGYNIIYLKSCDEINLSWFGWITGTNTVGVRATNVVAWNNAIESIYNNTGYVTKIKVPKGIGYSNPLSVPNGAYGIVIRGISPVAISAAASVSYGTVGYSEIRIVATSANTGVGLQLGNYVVSPPFAAGPVILENCIVGCTGNLTTHPDNVPATMVGFGYSTTIRNCFIFGGAEACIQETGVSAYVKIHDNLVGYTDHLDSGHNGDAFRLGFNGHVSAIAIKQNYIVKAYRGLYIAGTDGGILEDLTIESNMWQGIKMYVPNNGGATCPTYNLAIKHCHFENNLSAAETGDPMAGYQPFYYDIDIDGYDNNNYFTNVTFEHCKWVGCGLDPQYLNRYFLKINRGYRIHFNKCQGFGYSLNGLSQPNEVMIGINARDILFNDCEAVYATTNWVLTFPNITVIDNSIDLYNVNAMHPNTKYLKTSLVSFFVSSPAANSSGYCSRHFSETITNLYTAYPGRVIAISARRFDDTNIVTGSISFQLYFSGSGVTDRTATVSAGTHANKYVEIDFGSSATPPGSFLSGTDIQLHWATSADWTETSSKWIVDLLIAM